MMFFLFLFYLTGDDSVNAGGLDVTVVVASAAASVVVVALFWRAGFLLLHITWIHPSFLSGWFPSSRSDLFGEVAKVAAVVVAVGLVAF